MYTKKEVMVRVILLWNEVTAVIFLPFCQHPLTKLFLRARKTLFLCWLQGVNKHEVDWHKTVKVNQQVGQHQWVNQQAPDNPWVNKIVKKWGEYRVEKKRRKCSICCLLFSFTSDLWSRWYKFFSMRNWSKTNKHLKVYCWKSSQN